MKKFTKIIMLAFVAVATLGLTSCDSDSYTSSTLDGVWRGQIASEVFTYLYGYETVVTDVEFEFYDDPYTYSSGTGVECDYYSGGYYEVRFNYTVKNGVIYLEYYDRDRTRLQIRKYRLSGNYFEGEFWDPMGNFLSEFRLHRVNGHYYYSKPGMYKASSPAKMRRK